MMGFGYECDAVRLIGYVCGVIITAVVIRIYEDDICISHSEKFLSIAFWPIYWITLIALVVWTVFHKNDTKE